MCNGMERLSRDEIDALADDIAIAAAHIDAATHQLLTSIRRFDAAGGWAWQGARSCAHWLSWRIGLGLGAAREKVRVAKALAELPHVDAALMRGELSFAKVRAITRVATPDNELLLLQYAQSATGAQLERICRSFRRVMRPPGRAHEDERYVRQRHLENGMVRIEAQVLPDEADLVMKAIQEARRAAARVSAETQTMVDGLVLAAESFLARGPKSRSGGERNQLFLHMTEERLASEPVFRATLSDGTILSGPTFLRLACDSGIVVAKVDGSGSLLDVGRRQRTIPPALRRALWLRDGGCRFPGCCARAYCEAHHIEHWSFGGPTSLFNTLLLCHYHHVLLHEGGFMIVRSPDETLLFLDPDGRCIHQVPAPPAIASDAFAALSDELRDLTIDARTNFARWSPEPLDLHASFDALCARTATFDRWFVPA